RDAGGNDRTPTGRELAALARDEVEARVSRIRVLRDHRSLAQEADGDLDQRAVEVAGSARASATRNGANRRTSRCGRRARMKTPSARSARRSIGGPSAYSSASLPPCEYGTSSSTTS